MGGAKVRGRGKDGVRRNLLLLLEGHWALKGL